MLFGVEAVCFNSNWDTFLLFKFLRPFKCFSRPMCCCTVNRLSAATLISQTLQNNTLPLLEITSSSNSVTYCLKLLEVDNFCFGFLHYMEINTAVQKYYSLETNGKITNQKISVMKGKHVDEKHCGFTLQWGNTGFSLVCLSKKNTIVKGKSQIKACRGKSQ